MRELSKISLKTFGSMFFPLGEAKNYFLILLSPPPCREYGQIAEYRTSASQVEDEPLGQ